MLASLAHVSALGQGRDTHGGTPPHPGSNIRSREQKDAVAGSLVTSVEMQEGKIYNIDSRQWFLASFFPPPFRLVCRCFTWLHGPHHRYHHLQMRTWRTNV